jgi:uncharacterized protein YlbG (UPF0298 family)
MELKPRTLITALCILGLLLASTPVSAKVYRWVDENGEVHYSESLPPDFKDKGHDVLNERGIVTDEDLTLTPPPVEEVPEEEQLKELPRDSSGMVRPKQLYSDAEMQRRMDNFLMLRYSSEQEIEDAMNVEIKQLNYDRRLLTTTRASMEQSFKGEIREAANKQRAGQQVTDKNSVEIQNLQQKLAQNHQSISLLDLREQEIRNEFQKQLDRYRFLEEQWADESPDT